MFNNYFKKFKRQSEDGLTLVELLIVIAILGMLAGVLIAVIDPAEQQRKSRDAQRIGDVRQLQSYVEHYYADTGNYPDSSAAGAYQKATCGGSLTESNGVTYMGKFPCDPSTGNKYSFSTTLFSKSTVGTYTITACLERAKNPQKDATIDFNCQSAGYPASYTQDATLQK